MDNDKCREVLLLQQSLQKQIFQTLGNTNYVYKLHITTLHLKIQCQTMEQKNNLFELTRSPRESLKSNQGKISMDLHGSVHNLNVKWSQRINNQILGNLSVFLVYPFSCLLVNHKQKFSSTEFPELFYTKRRLNTRQYCSVFHI